MIPDTYCDHGVRWCERCVRCLIAHQQHKVEHAKAVLREATEKLEALKMERRAEKAGVEA